MSNIVKRKLACADVLKYNDIAYSLKEIQRLFLLMNKLDQFTHKHIITVHQGIVPVNELMNSIKRRSIL